MKLLSDTLIVITFITIIAIVRVMLGGMEGESE